MVNGYTLDHIYHQTKTTKTGKYLSGKPRRNTHTQQGEAKSTSMHGHSAQTMVYTSCQNSTSCSRPKLTKLSYASVPVLSALTSKLGLSEQAMAFQTKLLNIQTPKQFTLGNNFYIPPKKLQEAN